MNLLEIIKSNVQGFENLELNPILDDKNITRGWNCTSFLENGFALSSGTHSDRDIALRICIAEALERAFFNRLWLENRQSNFFLNDFPTTCGFACGFDRDRTKQRSLAEALERWAWSQWIDIGYKISMITKPSTLDDLSLTLFTRFDQSRFYLKSISFEGTTYQFGVFLGFKNNGIFPGSRVCTLDEDPWQHSIIEAYRNFHNFNLKNNELYLDPSVQVTKTNFVEARNVYFGSNADSALHQINKAEVLEWPTPVIQIQKEYQTGINGVYFWRTIFDKWIPWSCGSIGRFVY